MIGDKIKELRKLEGLSQQKFADLIGTAKISVYEWEKGKSEPTTASIKKITEHKQFKQYALWLISDEETKQRTPPANATEMEFTETISAMTKVERKQVYEYIEFIVSRRGNKQS